MESQNCRDIEVPELPKTCREGVSFDCPQQLQTPIPAKLGRLCINNKTSSGSLLPIVSMMQTAHARV
jgi:hypothetical protein